MNAATDLLFGDGGEEALDQILPLFVWAMYATSIIQVLATPVLALSLCIVGVDHWFDWGLFDPARGGDPVLYQHLFWFYSHPAVYIMILPAMGVISEVVPTFSHKNPASYRAIAYRASGSRSCGFGTWGHHMLPPSPGSRRSTREPSASCRCSSRCSARSRSSLRVTTMRRGSLVLRTPDALLLRVPLPVLVFGVMIGVATATQSLDVHWHDTYFVVAHFHFVMVGGTLTAWLAALHYWWPKMTGRMYPERWGMPSAALIFAGFFMTFFPQFLLGNAGMPRRYYDYDPKFQTLHVVSTVGSWLLGGGMLMTFVYLFVALFKGERAPANPWDSRSYEWYTASPPPTHSFTDAQLSAEPMFRLGPYDYSEPAERTE